MESKVSFLDWNKYSLILNDGNKESYFELTKSELRKMKQDIHMALWDTVIRCNE